ncbi:MAG: polysaccharide deacetylase family protein [Rikenellaceae bacterium]|jgi:peptidoglycan/xylan/chitin deacetylase (PgdA/CDA1 family)|nr:polysaccharide deacetylase family protein [Rikenellaceae bacterium]
MQFKPPLLLKRLFPAVIWEFPESREVFLTFDDGPTPEITPWVLDQLREYGFKATFFCLGKNVEQHPEIFQRILDEGHAVGNHTYSHQKGWEMKTWRYIEDVDFADDLIHSNLVRPPYGRIKPAQARRLSERYRIVLWSVLSRDYSSLVSPRKCLKNVTKHVQGGSIILFHDSKKAFRNLKYALPRVLQFLKEQGYSCAPIEL